MFVYWRLRVELLKGFVCFGGVVFGSVFDAFCIIFSKDPKINHALQKPITKIPDLA